ncbi:MAG: pentapeptide repeat-containing protein [Gloeotrichia echinulata CP02]
MLFKRLEKFYRRWCQGKFIDSAEETLPQKKLRQLQKYKIIGLGQRQVDIYAGLNVMILLLELHRYAQGRDDLTQQIIFYPSDKPEKYPLTTQLLRIINYSDGIKLGNFNSVVGRFLSRANLSGANLSGANLSGADLSSAYLSRADLSSAYLSRANLNSADLRGANLSSADLRGANLRGANLSDADLSSANLSGAILSRANLNSADLRGANLSSADIRGANLRGANLRGADLSSANLSGAYLGDAYLSNEVLGDIRWDENTKWEGVRGLDTAKNVPEALKLQLGLS